MARRDGVFREIQGGQAKGSPNSSVYNKDDNVARKIYIKYSTGSIISFGSSRWASRLLAIYVDM